jgi:putative tricarboxylic transport membrane protein
VKWARTASGVVLLVFGLGVCWQAALLALGEPDRPGPGFYPLVLGAVLMLVAVWVVMEARSSPGEAEPPMTRSDNVAAVAVVPGLLVAFALVLEPLGYVISMFLMMGLLLRLAGRGWPAAAGMALASTLLSFFLFDMWLGVPLPKGVLQQLL